MALNETFKASVIMQGTLGTAFVFDFGYVDNASGTNHIDTGIAAGDFQTLVQTTLAAALPDAITFKRYRFACVGGTHLGEIGYVEVDPPVTGTTSVYELLPAEVCISMKRATGYASRRDRGRVFFGPVMDLYRNPTNSDLVDLGNVQLQAVRDLVTSNLVTQTRTLHPVILASNGTYSGRVITRGAIAEVLVHRKSRRFRVGV